MTREVNWTDLPNDLLFTIAHKTSTVDDCIRFAAVCSSWRSGVYTDKQKNIPQQPPALLILPTKTCSSACSLHDNRLSLKYTVCLSHETVCRGSDHGWLVIVFENRDIHLQNPFSAKDVIRIPPLPCQDQLANGLSVSYMRKAVLSANPSENQSFVIMAIQQNDTLYFWKNGDLSWTPIPNNYRADDIIYYKDEFHAFRFSVGVFVFDVTGHSIRVSLIKARFLSGFNGSYGYKRYLVESRGELLQILRHSSLKYVASGLCQRTTDNFSVFKLDQIKKEWILVTDLGDRILFIGDHFSSFCLSTSDMPRCKPNTIYFVINERDMTSKERVFFDDIGVYSLKYKCITPLLFPTIESKKTQVTLAPIFIQPTVRFKLSVLQGSCFMFAIFLFLAYFVWLFEHVWLY